MPQLTYAQGWTQLKAVIDLLDETYKFGYANTPNYRTLEEAILAATAGDYRAAVLNSIAPTRNGISAVLAPGSVLRHLTGALLDMGRAINAAERTPDAILQRLYDYMHANSKTVNSRSISYASMSAGGSNVGNAAVTRVTVDENGYNLEACHVELKTIECILDQNQVDRDREVWEIRGIEPEPDFLQVVGSGINLQSGGRVVALSSVDSQELLSNPSFDQYGGTTQPTAGSPQTPTATTSVTGWTLGDVTDFAVDVDTVYRSPVGVATPKSLKFVDNGVATQVLLDTTRARILTRTPYYYQVAVYRKDSCDGTLTIEIGGVSRAVTMTTLNDNAWNVIKVPATPGTNSYYKAFKQNAVDNVFTLASRTTGSLFLDDIVWAAMPRIDGTFWAVVGGATRSLRFDSFTGTDTETNRGVLQEWLAFRSGLGLSLPSNTGGTETETDP